MAGYSLGGNGKIASFSSGPAGRMESCLTEKCPYKDLP
jgi:hypothetical protein